MNEQEQAHFSSTITVHALAKQLQTPHDYLLLDVRSMEEFHGDLGHLPDAIVIPVQELEQRLSELEAHKEKTIIAYCRSGNRSHHATVFLNNHGFKSLNMVGGMLRWNAEKLPAMR